MKGRKGGRLKRGKLNVLEKWLWMGMLRQKWMPTWKYPKSDLSFLCIFFVPFACFILVKIYTNLLSNYFISLCVDLQLHLFHS